MSKNNRQVRRIATLVVVLAVMGAARSTAQDWPQFRGENRDGISPEKGLVAKWPESGPKELWRVPLGEGYSAISIVGDRLYTMYAGDHEGAKRELAAAFDAKTGKELWRTPMGEKYDNEFGNGPRATPTVAGESVYVLDSRGTLAALSTENGSLRWELNLIEAFGAQMPTFGFSTSPIVDGDQLVIESAGSDGKSYVGLSTKTGEVEWSSGRSPAQPGYNSPIRVEMNGEPRYIYLVSEFGGDDPVSQMTCMDTEGKEVWSHPWPMGETHASPVFVPPNKIFASGAEGVGAKLLQVKEKGGSAEVTEVWSTRLMRNHFSTSVYHEGHLYGFDNATLKCISAEDGDLAWAKRGMGKGSLIFADGKLFVLSDRGLLVMLEATAKGYVEKGSVQALEGRCWTAPTLSNGRLYLRNHEEMVVYDLKG